MKPSYPELLKAFKFSCNQKNSKEGQEYISQIIERLVLSEDWKKEEMTPPSCCQLLPGMGT
jgi:hypothetical protein